MSVRLTLMRHGRAEPYSGDDAGRPLSPEGVEQVAAVTQVLVAGGWRPGAIVHSPLKRAVQTAELVAAQLPPGLERVALSEVVAAGPALLAMLGRLDLPDPLVVGHNPGISELARTLLGAGGPLPFGTASAACFDLHRLPPASPATLLFFTPSELIAPS